MFLQLPRQAHAVGDSFQVRTSQTAPWTPRNATPGMSIACLEAHVQEQPLHPTAPRFWEPPVSTCHHSRLAALVHSCARGTAGVHTSNPGEPLQPGNPGYPASPCQTDKAGVSMSGAHGKTPSIIPEPQKRDIPALSLASRWMALQEGSPTAPCGTLPLFLHPTMVLDGQKPGFSG